MSRQTLVFFHSRQMQSKRLHACNSVSREYLIEFIGFDG